MFKNKIALFSVVAALLSGSSAFARTQPGSLSRANPWSDGACFYSSGGAMTNTCDGYRALALPLVMDADGGHWFRVMASAPVPSSNVGCLAAAGNEAGTSYTFTSRIWLTGPAGYLSTSFSLPPWGSAYGHCLVGKEGRVVKVDYWK